MLKYTDFDIVFQEIPGEISLALNLSNCPHRCKGCHSPQLQENIGAPLNESVLTELLEKYGQSITCVCFMGGDASPGEVSDLCAWLKERSQGKIKTAWYSGCNELPKNCRLNHFDFIKLGDYREKLGGLDSKTTNQRLYKIQTGKCEDITYLMQKKGLQSDLISI